MKKTNTTNSVNEALYNLLKEKSIKCLEDMFNLIKHLMEYVENYDLTGKEKKKLVYDNILCLLYRNSIIEDIYRKAVNIYILLINPYIENIITISKTTLLLNLKKN